MKKTLQEEKDRIFKIINEISGESSVGFNRDENDKRYLLFDALNKYYDIFNDWDVFEEKISVLMTMVKKNKIYDPKDYEDSEDEPFDPPTLRYRDTGGTEGG